MTSPTVGTPRPRAVLHRELQRSRPLYRRLRSSARTAALQVVAAVRTQSLADDAIHFPYYHWVLDDERTGFDRQLRELKLLGDFISLDDAVTLLSSGEPIEGRYFCITFDDGFRNNLTTALPILVERDVSAAFFLPTSLIGLDLDRDWDRIARHYTGATGGYGQYFEYMNWNDVRELHATGMSIGSHTCGHVRLADLDDAAARREMADSKCVIEEQLHAPCRHFAAPFGRPGRDYVPQRDPEIARQLGYASFLTTCRGPNRGDASPLQIRRNDVLASHGPLLFRYLMAREEPAGGRDT
jgi:peptidoglycan/xylan/chitin deacetylase (PgdA/CDA1 family)